MEKKEIPGEVPKKLNYPKERLLQVMGEVLLDSVDYLIQYSNTCKELQKKGPEQSQPEIEELSEELHKSLLELEQDVCLLRGIDIEKYYEDVTFYDTNNDAQVKEKLDLLGKLIETALKGDKIVVNFKVAPELTKERTIKLYKMILSSHLHLHYMEVQKYIKDHPNATPEEIQQIFENNDAEKTKRRDQLLENEKVPKEPGQDYRMVLHAAYYTYLTNDAEFEKQIQKVLKLNSSLMNQIRDKNTIPELKLDPMTMKPALFEEFYNRIESKYLHGAPVPSLI